MLCYKMKEPLVRESHARTALTRFASLGASIHRIGNGKEFELIVPLRRPHKRHAVLKQLERQAFGQSFGLIWLLGMNADGLRYTSVREDQLDERGHLIEPLDGSDDADDWLDEAATG